MDWMERLAGWYTLQEQGGQSRLRRGAGKVHGEKKGAQRTGADCESISDEGDEGDEGDESGESDEIQVDEVSCKYPCGSGHDNKQKPDDL